MNQQKHKIFNLFTRYGINLALFIGVVLFGFITLNQPSHATHATDCSDVYTPLSTFVNEGVNTNKAAYIQVMNETAVPWELLAAIHYRETSFGRNNPANGQGIFQFVDGAGGPYPAGPVSEAEFIRQLRHMATKIQDDYVSRGSVPRERRRLVANEQNIALVKDTLFSYNGRASLYTNQAVHFGFDPTNQPYEGSPYVMNRFDCARARMGIITRDYGTGIDGIDTRYGAFTIFARLRGDSYRNSLMQPYLWQINSSQVFINPTRTQQFTSRITVAPGGKVYVRVKALNTGSEIWNKSFMKVGTNRPNDSLSKLYDPSWISGNRLSALTEDSVAPGAIGTFDFILAAPNNPGSYTGYFNIVAEGRTWLNDLGLIYGVNVVAPTNPINSSNLSLPSGQILKPKEYLLSPDTQSVLQLQEDGNLVLKTNFMPIWSSGTSGKNVKHLIMQGDGNLVLYDNNNSPLWYSSTSSATPTQLVLQSDANLVLYNQAYSPLWSTSTFSVPDHLSYVNPSLPKLGIMLPGQQLETPTRKYRAVLQTDGNFVLYSSNKAIWSSGTFGTNIGFAIMQSDGNLVLYDKLSQPLWSSRTSNRGSSHLELQEDGNMVIYDNKGVPTWSTGTSGR